MLANFRIKKIFFFVSFIFCFSFPGKIFAWEQSGYPKIHMPSGGMSLPSASFLQAAVNYDLIVVSADMLANQNLYSLLQETKRQNPDLIVLLYIAVQEVPEWSIQSSPFYGAVYRDALNAGWLVEGCGACSCGWGTQSNLCVDVSSGWKTYVPNKMREWTQQKDSSNLVSGVYYDNFKLDPYCCPQNATIWIQSLQTIADNTTGIVGGNDIFYPSSSPYVNHLDFSSREMWPAMRTPCGWRTNWNNGMRSFYGWVKTGGIYGIAHEPPEKTGTDYATMRLGLATSLLADRGFYHYWPGVREGILVYDEYAVDLDTGQATRRAEDKGYLGLPVGEAFDPQTGETLDQVYRRDLTGCTDGTSADLSSHVWVREYQNGVVIVNPSSSAKTVAKNQLPKGGDLKRISGSQDPSVNNGSLIGASITIPPSDAIILLAITDTTNDCEGASRTQRAKGDFNFDYLVNLIDYNYWVAKYVRAENPTEDLSCSEGAGIQDFSVWANQYQSSLK